MGGVCKSSIEENVEYAINLDSNQRFETGYYINQNIFTYYSNKTFDNQCQTSFNGNIIQTVNISEDQIAFPQFYIIKEIKKSIYKLKNNNNFNELSLINNIVHPNILVPQEIQDTEAYWHLLYKRPKGTLLSQIIKDGEINNDLKSIFDIINQLINLTDQLNSIGLMIRNLNPDVIIQNKQLCKIYLFDIGSCEYYPTTSRIKTNIVYSAPEMIRDKEIYSKECDVQTIGIIFFMLLYSESPYGDILDESVLCQKVKDGNIMEFNKFSNQHEEQIEDLLKKFLTVNVKSRPTLKELQKMKIFQVNFKNEDDLKESLHLTMNSLNLQPHQLFTNFLGVKFELQKYDLIQLWRSFDMQKIGKIPIDYQKDLIIRQIKENDLSDNYEYQNTLIDDLKKDENSQQLFIDEFLTSNFSIDIESKYLNKFFDKIKQIEFNSEYEEMAVQLKDFLYALDIIDPKDIEVFQNQAHCSEFFNGQKQTLDLTKLLDTLLRGTQLKEQYKNEEWYKRIRLQFKNLIELENEKKREEFKFITITTDVIDNEKNTAKKSNKFKSMLLNKLNQRSSNTAKKDFDQNPIRLNISRPSIHQELNQESNNDRKNSDLQLLVESVASRKLLDVADKEYRYMKTKTFENSLIGSTEFIDNILKNNDNNPNQLQQNYFDDIELSQIEENSIEI